MVLEVDWKFSLFRSTSGSALLPVHFGPILWGGSLMKAWWHGWQLGRKHGAG